jgi:catechol 2,3-dioxygenase-like lactoylglutathione lyase family enzyme
VQSALVSDDPAEVRASPVLPVTDLEAALAHYAELGFVVSRHSADYGFAAWHGLELHLSARPDHDPLRTAAAVFLHVPDADAVFAQWSAAAGGRHVAPEEKPWRVREGAHVDPDGNLLRFGSPLAFGR